MLRVGLDWSLVERNPKSGMGVYVSQIYTGLVDENPENEISRVSLTPKSTGYKILDFVLQPLFVQLKLLWFVYSMNLDAVYVPNPPAPFFSPVPIILTIPDLSFIFDNSSPILLRTYLFISYYVSAHAAGVITTFSQNSKHDIAKYLRIDYQKINIVAPAVKPSLIGRSQSKHKDIILTIPGSFIPRKNVGDVMTAFTALPIRLQKKYRLVCVGNVADSHFLEFKKNIKDSKRVTYLGPLSDKDLVNLYTKSACLVCTSLYEGFGLTPLEAMANGVPVIAYNNSSLPEIVGNAGVLVEDSTELTTSLVKILTNKKIQAKYIQAGRKKINGYSWSKSARSLNLLFENAIS